MKEAAFLITGHILQQRLSDSAIPSGETTISDYQSFSLNSHIIVYNAMNIDSTGKPS